MNEFEKALDIVEAKTMEVPDVVYHGAVMIEPPVKGDDISGLAYVVFDPKDIEILEWN